MRTPVFSAPPHGIAAQLRVEPGQWYRLATVPHSRRGVLATTAYRIRHGARQGFEQDLRGGSFEAKVRTVDGEAHLYVRFVSDRDPS